MYWSTLSIDTNSHFSCKGILSLSNVTLSTDNVTLCTLYSSNQMNSTRFKSKIEKTRIGCLRNPGSVTDVLSFPKNLHSLRSLTQSKCVSVLYNQTAELNLPMFSAGWRTRQKATLSWWQWSISGRINLWRSSVNPSTKR